MILFWFGSSCRNWIYGATIRKRTPEFDRYHKLLPLIVTFSILLEFDPCHKLHNPFNCIILFFLLCFPNDFSDNMGDFIKIIPQILRVRNWFFFFFGSNPTIPFSFSFSFFSMTHPKWQVKLQFYPLPINSTSPTTTAQLNPNYSIEDHKRQSTITLECITRQTTISRKLIVRVGVKVQFYCTP